MNFRTYLEMDQYGQTVRVTSWILYGQFIDGHYTNIFDHPSLVEMCYCKGSIEELEFKLHEIQTNHNFNETEPRYFGWINFKENNKLEYVWPSMTQCVMCVDNHKEKEQNGEGMMVRLKVKSLGIIQFQSFQPEKLCPEKPVKIEPESVIKLKKRKIQWKN